MAVCEGGGGFGAAHVAPTEGKSKEAKIANIAKIAKSKKAKIAKNKQITKSTNTKIAKKQRKQTAKTQI